MRNQNSRQSFTLIELVIIMAIIALLSGLATVSLLNIYKTNSLTANLDVLLVDIRSQQLKAMMEDTDGAPASIPYGIYFEPSRYILFRGSSYLPGDPFNFSVLLNTDLNFVNINLPASSLIFTPLAGELSAFVNGLDTVTLKDTQGSEEKTIKVNRFGVINNIF